MLSLLERFMCKVNKTDGCWLWIGAHNFEGYGHMRVREKSKASHRLSYEIFNGPIPPGLCVCHTCDNPKCVNPKHLFLGTRSDNMLDKVRKGRHRSGVFPDGFWSEFHKRKWARRTPKQRAEIGRKIAESQKGCEFSGSHLENLRAAHFKRRGKTPNFKRPLPQTKLNPEAVVEVRQRYSNGEAAQKLADETGVSVSCISKVVLGKDHKRAGGPISSGRYKTGQWKQNISSSNKGRKFSDEHLGNLRAALKVRDKKQRRGV